MDWLNNWWIYWLTDFPKTLNRVWKLHWDKDWLSDWVIDCMNDWLNEWPTFQKHKIGSENYWKKSSSERVKIILEKLRKNYLRVKIIMGKLVPRTHPAPWPGVPLGFAGAGWVAFLGVIESLVGVAVALIHHHDLVLVSLATEDLSGHHSKATLSRALGKEG